ncbi:Ger(x)C family spore germination protein [Bacillus shivajii]|uniref:Ger(x)C family spore germination protein n=1 Tax=Bacillus shivajii TaxID=1983719 RepID=UPI001CFC16AE|nr:Ger(x)C family spore germination protein [Bacillus shivajii]UCZ51507.1 Ger(x)C family spore germination protein [Bacillus shivajii]
MVAKKLRYKYGLFLFVLFIQAGCVEQQILDEQKLIFGVGYDLVDEDKIEGTVSIPTFQTEAQVESVTISATAKTSRDIGTLLETKSSRPLHPGKIKSILFDYHLAENGIMTLLDTFIRDPNIGLRIFLATVDKGSTKELLTEDYNLEEDTATYIEEMIEQNIDRQTIPTSNIFTFISSYFQEGKDAFLPNIQLNDEQIQITGLTLFKGDRAVHRLNLRQAFLIKLLVEPAREGTYELTLNEEDDEYAVIRNISSNNDVTVDLSKRIPEIDVSVQFKGKVKEYSGHTLDEKKVKEIQRSLEKTLSKEMNRLIFLLQKKKVDPIGFGAKVKAKDKHFDLEKWNKQYHLAPIRASIDVVITETGVEE